MTWEEYKSYFCRSCSQGCYERIGCAGPVFCCCLLLVVLLCGCRTQYVPVETVRTERVEVHDSIYVETLLHDSVTIRSNGDTVVIEHWRDRWRDRWRDSIRVDSVQVPVPVERKLSKWESFCVDYGKIMVGATSVSVIGIVLVLWFLRRHPRR